MLDYIHAFKIAMQEHLGPLEFTPIPDGSIHRERAPGDKPGSLNLWYVLFPGNTPGGAFGNWKTGLSQTWSGKNGATGQDMEALQRRIAEAKKLQEEAQAKRQQEAAYRAKREWNAAPPAWVDHPYLQRKQIPALGVRQQGNCLLVPLTNAGGEIVNLQRIYPDGSKRFLPGGQLKGCFAPIGKADQEGRIYIAEGWATGLTLHTLTKRPVACAMTANNLDAVAKVIRANYLASEIVIAADDDKRTEGNPGKTSAEAAAMAVGALVTLPNGYCRENCPCTDFNDLYCCSGSIRDD